MPFASLGGIVFDIDPDSVSWNFSMKISEKKTVGGTVVQVYGTQVGDMTVTGTFGPLKGTDTEAWQSQERFRERVQTWAAASVTSSGSKPLRFLYPPRKWDFQVFIKDYTSPDGQSVHHSNTIINPQWTLTLFIVQDTTNQIVKGIQDAYLARLMNGIGWKQTTYNGPMNSSDVTSQLGGKDLWNYLEGQYAKAAGAGKDTSTGGGQKGDSGNVPKGTATTAQITGWIKTAFADMNKQLSPQDLKDLLILIFHESTNQTGVTNTGDRNAKAGHASRGLMQVIPSTFKENAIPGHDSNIVDPVSNIIAGVRYGIKTYGSIHNIPGLVALRAGRAYVGY